MFRHSLQFENTIEDCNCNLLAQIKPLFTLSRPIINQHNKQPLSNKKHHKNQHPPGKSQKISIASHKINKQLFAHKRIKSHISGQKHNNEILFSAKQENYFKNQNIKINQMNQCKTARNMYVQPIISTQQVYIPQYFYINSANNQNFYQQSMSKLYKNKTYSSTSYYSSLPLTQTIKIKQIPVKKLIQIKTNTCYLSPNNIQTHSKNLQIETQASNYIAPLKKQSSEIQEQQEREPSISENVPKRRQPLTHFRVIESINGLTDQSLDRFSEVLSHGFHRNQAINQNQNNYYQRDPLIVQKLRSSENSNVKLFQKKRTSHGQILSTKF